MSIKSKLAASAATLAAIGGFAVAAAGPASATQTCNTCFHVYNEYAFRGALAAAGQGTAVNTPIVLWYENRSTTDPGADFLVHDQGKVTATGGVNQSALNWVKYAGDHVVRFQYAPYGNTSANTYIGLKGTKVAIRNDNPNSIWQEWIVVPNDQVGLYGHGFVLINVGESTNTNDPLVLTDPQNAVTGSLVQQDVQPVAFNQQDTVPTNQVWDGLTLFFPTP
jgi:hypothetical protein